MPGSDEWRTSRRAVPPICHNRGGSGRSREKRRQSRSVTDQASPILPRAAGPVSQSELPLEPKWPAPVDRESLRRRSRSLRLVVQEEDSQGRRGQKLTGQNSPKVHSTGEFWRLFFARVAQSIRNHDSQTNPSQTGPSSGQRRDLPIRREKPLAPSPGRLRYSSMTFLTTCTKWGLFFDSESSWAFLSASFR